MGGGSSNLHKKIIDFSTFWPLFVWMAPLQLLDWCNYNWVYLVGSGEKETVLICVEEFDDVLCTKFQFPRLLG